MSGKKYTMGQFIDALNGLDKKVRGDVLAKAAMAGGQVVEAQAKINVKDTFNTVTGNLGNSIQTVLESSTPTRAEVSVGPTAIYGRIQELGGTVKPLKARKLYWLNENGELRSAFEVTLPARPYMKPALEEHEEKVLEAMRENLRIEIEGAI